MNNPQVAHLKEQYLNAIKALKRLADQSDYSEIGDHAFEAQRRKCKRIHRALVAAELWTALQMAAPAPDKVI